MLTDDCYCKIISIGYNFSRRLKSLFDLLNHWVKISINSIALEGFFMPELFLLNWKVAIESAINFFIFGDLSLKLLKAWFILSDSPFNHLHCHEVFLLVYTTWSKSLEHLIYPFLFILLITYLVMKSNIWPFFMKS